VFYILGFGCWADSEIQRIPDIKHRCSTLSGISDVRVMCNKSAVSTISTIVGSFCKKIPNASAFAASCIEKVAAELNDPWAHVLVIGVSYGGYVASKIAEELAMSPEVLGRLKVRTFNSIYVPTPKPAGVDIVHSIAFNDMSLECNGLTYNTSINLLSHPRPDIAWFTPLDEYQDVARINIAKRTEIHGSIGLPLHEVLLEYKEHARAVNAAAKRAGPAPALNASFLTNWRGGRKSTATLVDALISSAGRKARTRTKPSGASSASRRQRKPTVCG
jgi:hypothetical protein